MEKISSISTALKAIFFTLGFSLPSYAKIDFPLITEYLPEGASIGVIAKNLNQDQIIADYHSTTFMLPASTQKVFTAVAAKLVLGDDFKFDTTLLTNGKIQNGLLEGNLIVHFTGDPDLTSGQLYSLLVELKKQGINKINGDLILDTSVFSSHDRGLGWIWNDLTMCFNSPPSAANIDNNCFYAELDANQAPGETVKINVPAQFPIQVFGQVYVADSRESPYCQLDVVVHDNNRYQVKGCLARQTKPFGLSFAVQDPDAYAAAIIQRQLKRLGIEFNGKVLQPQKPQQGQLLAQHFSKPLPDLLKKMMKKSDNQIADSLFRSIAYHYYKRPASFQLGTLAVKSVLQKQGIKFGNSILADGSGLSRHNLVAPKTMLSILEYIAKNEDKLHLMETFPVAGVDGTISGRGGLINPPLVKNVIAKTGSLKGVYNLVGFMTNARGEKIAFVQFINGYSTGELENKTKRAPLVQFESGLYNQLYKE
ncbi:serine-type D-Ala-D-Ala carboxypeptidase [Rodentibacter caecimuris]|uniref:Serine-type D-Ala-D-Ala carboxypeptidase n=1 Tax=Rodentibacter caecimuris TaxID=1796644 RepID=A0A9X8W0S8_9PAST|nr:MULTISPECIES: serine-type D-Ala-D-Ala carboxypeptidase [Pasteurellaceae]AOF54329.1 D-alanyl-D-alanine carboxypeptidase [Pasteurellaceae bacterium NI1060]MCQ9122862.1 serine-type D-Ala-D-Ala carboxypeptidase [Rodentibacter heylii]MCR1837859.1 serine-type D-Ala-D-Ala carboxypeptidase [Pasteurella caecimuris]MCU0106324.1 serine-type D-Ala-D-Ala carboxypeptidase [Pasteurella caecimuris]OOF71818.1 serine-type D-Ala-D-Ala carboxypeptidase [Rodentibacter heylii]